MAERFSILTGSPQPRRAATPTRITPAQAPAKPSPELEVLRQVVDMNLAKMLQDEREQAKQAREAARQEREERARRDAEATRQREQALAAERAQRDAEAARRAQEREEWERQRTQAEELAQAHTALQAETERLREAEKAALERAARAERLAAERPAPAPAPAPTPAVRLSPDQIKFTYKRDERDYLREVVLHAEGYEDVGVLIERGSDGRFKHMKVR